MSSPSWPRTSIPFWQTTTSVAGVLCGANGIFSGGADIHGFGKPTPSGPTLRDVQSAIDRGSKVFVAALEGIAFGGGLELAQACDYRVAQKATRVGQPEIKLGLLPGAGGTQRLPRLIGLDAALEMDVGGEPISAERARELGLIDELVDGNVVDAAAAFARSHAAHGRRRARDLDVRGDARAIEAARKRAEPAERGGLAAHYTIDAVEGALALPFDDATQSRARAVRAAARIRAIQSAHPRLLRGTRSREGTRRAALESQNQNCCGDRQRDDGWRDFDGAR